MARCQVRGFQYVLEPAKYFTKAWADRPAEFLAIRPASTTATTAARAGKDRIASNNVPRGFAGENLHQRDDLMVDEGGVASSLAIVIPPERVRD